MGKTTLARQLMSSFVSAQYLNWDVLQDRMVLQRQSWNPRARLLVMGEIRKMRDWKAWLKGVFDGRSLEQALLVTGSARMETFRQGGDSLAGRYFAFRLHPLSVREWCEQQKVAPTDALDHLLARGGFPEPCLAADAAQADRWRAQYFNDLIREDVLEFSRLHEINTMRLFVEKHVNFLQDTAGRPAGLHYIRTKDGAEVDFALSEDGKMVQMIECKWGDSKPHRGLMRFAEQFADTDAVPVVYGLRQEEFRNGIKITDAANWLMGLAA